MQELVQLVAMLSSLSDFGVAANPKAAPPAELMRYGMDDADVFFYFDVEAIVPRNYGAFVALQGKPALKDAPELRAELSRVIEQAEQARAGVVAASGIDPVTSVKSIAVWMKIDGAQPVAVVAVRGTFRAGTAETLARHASGRVQVAMAPNGQLLAATPGLLDARLAKGWKRTSRDEAPALAGKPFLALFASPSAGAKELVRRNQDDDTRAAAAPVLAMIDASLSLRHDGVSWTYQGADRDAFEIAALASDGIIHLMRSAHLFGRGAARLILAGLRAHGGHDPGIAAVLAHEKELLRLVDAWTGDGRFVAVIERKPARNTVMVRATGRSLSHVLPLAGILPVAGAAAYLGLRSGGSAPATVEAGAAAPAMAPGRAATGRPLDVGGVYRRAKQKRGAR